MIPDKIYLPKEEIEERMPWIAAPYEDDPNWDECYIRKEDLVERINKQILFYKNSVSVNDYEEGCNKGAIAALEHVVKSL